MCLCQHGGRQKPCKSAPGVPKGPPEHGAHGFCLSLASPCWVGLKFDVIRSRHASGQNLWALWPDQLQGERGVPRSPRLSRAGGGLIPTGGSARDLLALRRMFRSQRRHEAGKVPQECVPVAAQPSRTPVSGRLWASLPGALSAGLSVVWLPGRLGSVPTQPRVPGIDNQGPSVGSKKINKQPQARETSPGLQVPAHVAGQRDPRGLPRRPGCGPSAGSCPAAREAGRPGETGRVCA